MTVFNLIAFAVLVSWSCFQTSGFVWEENNDESLFESDIKLKFEQKLALLLTGNIDASVGLTRGITKDKNKLWVDAVFPYNITEDLRNNSRAMDAIYGAFHEWETQTCIKFVEWAGEKDYVEFFGSGKGCWSYVGRVGGKQRISLADGCWQPGTIAHEIGHALGFWHEQSRPDRDKYVTIHWDKIPDSKKHNFRKYNQSAIDSLGSPYDYISVMHYSSTAFGRGNITITAKDPSVTQLGQRLGLSPLDVQQADALYQCNGETTVVTPSPPTRPPPPSGRYDCTFENGTCGYTNVPPEDGLDTFDWTLRIAGTPSGNTGPTTDHTTGRFGHFFYTEASVPRVKDDVALLQSPKYPTFKDNQCFTFYYHMFGRHMGELNVYIKRKNLVDNTKIWSKKGNQGNKWRRAKIQLKPFSEEFQLVFEGVRGDGYQGDIAIDDIQFVSGNCSFISN